MNVIELQSLLDDKKVLNASWTLYQQKVRSFLYAAIATRLDIVFAVSRLFWFNQRLGRRHYKTANQVFYYLFWTQDYCICYGGESWDISSFVCASNVSFADNLLDQKSSQGYLMKLFGGAIAWKTNKQDTMTIFSTKAELLMVSQTAKKAIYLFRLMKALTLVLLEALAIKVNNWQTICLLVDEAMKL